MLLVLGVIAVVAAAILFGEVRWQSGTRELRHRIESERLPIEIKVFDAHELEGAPTPVQRYFQTALKDQQRIVAAVSVKHTGTINMSEAAEQWKPFTSTQFVVTRRPGFDWDGRVAMMPGLPVRVHDAYVAGEGILHAAVLGLVSMVNLRGSGVKDGGLTVTLLFRFNEDGLIDTVRAAARGRTVGGTVVPTPWQGRFWNYATRDGMRVPLDGEVAWLLPEGAKPYWRGHITNLGYELAQ